MNKNNIRMWTGITWLVSQESSVEPWWWWWGLKFCICQRQTSEFGSWWISVQLRCLFHFWKTCNLALDTIQKTNTLIHRTNRSVITHTWSTWKWLIIKHKYGMITNMSRDHLFGTPMKMNLYKKWADKIILGFYQRSTLQFPIADGLAPICRVLQLSNVVTLVFTPYACILWMWM